VSEERKRILQMLAAGKISAEEAEQLLDAIPAGGDTAVKRTPTGRSTRFLRVHVVEEGVEKVNVNVPLGLAKFLLKFVPDHVTNGNKLDIDEIVSQINDETQGKIVEVVDGRTTVDVYVE
jgi:hypothetical protein